MGDGEKEGGTHDVILKVLANTLNIQEDGNTGSSQDVLGPNTAVHQDIGTSDSTGSQNNLFADVDGGDRASLNSTKLDTSCSHLIIEKDLGDGGIRQYVEIGTRGQRIDVGSAGVRTRPVGWVDGRGSNKTSPCLATKWVGILSDSDVLESGYPIGYDGKGAETRGDGCGKW